MVERLALAVLIPTHAVSALAESKVGRAMTGLQTAVFAGGCFWGVDAAFKHVKGVASVESGYAGGSADMANYEAVSSGRAGHAEAVRVRYNPAQVSYPQLLQVFMMVAHDPTRPGATQPARPGCGQPISFGNFLYRSRAAKNCNCADSETDSGSDFQQTHRCRRASTAHRYTNRCAETVLSR